MADQKLPRREREKLRQRQEMLAAALYLFSQKGYHNVSMHEIAEKAESVECDFLRVTFAWNAGTANLVSIKEPMLSLGEELFAWTPEMHIRSTFGTPDNVVPFEIGDFGGGRGFTLEP